MALRKEEIGHIFRAYDIRGIYNKELIPEFLVEIGLAAVSYLGEDTYLTGMDVRASSPVLYEALITGLRAGGAKVIDTGTLPIGALLYGCSKMDEGYAAYITASHLPPEWNGVKFFFAGGLGIEPRDNYGLRDVFIRGEYRRASWSRIGKRLKVNLLEEYLEFLTNSFELNGIKVGLDCGNGATVLTAPYAFKEVGAKIKALNAFIDPSFSSRGPEPRPDNLHELSNLIRREKLDFGVAYDGDGDRGIFVNCEGKYMCPEEVSIVILEGLKLRGKVVATVDASMILDDYCRERGLELIRVPVGHNFVMKEVKKSEAVLGVEHSGHILVPGKLGKGRIFAADDALWASMKFAEAYSKLGRNIEELVPRKYIYRSLKVKVKEQDKGRIMELLKKSLLSKYSDIETIDGIKLYMENSWLLIRPSNTEPVIRVSVEAEREEDVISAMDKALAELKKAMKSLS
ncbi:MAG: hypothetical protein B6U69_03145 [Thermofilum sp. ex4484_15]|nr:MAG: hypothetical protein B6U69_03145 [Thermofilum sp. ex4484_15]